MAKYTPSTVSSGYSTSEINTELSKVAAAVNDQLDKKGGSGNQMEADLDMNSNDILNAKFIEATTLRVGGREIVESTGAGIIEGRPYEDLAAAIADPDLELGDRRRIQGIGDFEIVSSNPDGYYVASANGFIKPIPDKIGRVDVRMYGAKADWNGVTGTDNSNFIQNASNDSEIIVIPKVGEFMLSSSILLDSGVEGGGTLVGKPDDFTVAANAPAVIIAKQKSNIVIKDLVVKGPNITVIGSSDGGGGVFGVGVDDCDNVTVSNVETYDTATGFWLNDPTKTSIRNILVDNCRAYRARSWSQDGNAGTPRGFLANYKGVKITNCLADECATGFYFGSADGVISRCVASNWSYDNGYYILADGATVISSKAIGGGLGSGFSIAYGDRNLVTSNYAENCPNKGFRLHAPLRNSIISGNIANGCGTGFSTEELSGSPSLFLDSCTITDNIAMNCDLNGFYLKKIKRSKITSNTSKNNNQTPLATSTRGGIRLQSEVESCDITGNLCIDDQSTQTQFDGVWAAGGASFGVVYNTISVQNESENTPLVNYDADGSATENRWLFNESGSITATFGSTDRFYQETITLSESYPFTPNISVTVQDTELTSAEGPPTAFVKTRPSPDTFTLQITIPATLASDKNTVVGWQIM